MIQSKEQIMFDNETYFDGEVYRWMSNDRIPFDDLLEQVGVDESIRQRCNKVRQEETAQLLEQYRKSEEEFWNHERYADARAERMLEMRAAFGEGETVVDVITGRKIKT